LDELFGPPPKDQTETKGLLSWFGVAKFAARVVIAVIKRRIRHRDHGGYTTIVEEVLRAAYLDRVGQIVWDMMKKDTADAFADETDVGSVVLNALAELDRSGRRFSQISLVGHSTGAVYICNFLAGAKKVLAGARFNVIFLAPACRFDLFQTTFSSVQSSVAGFRMFAMSDALESQDCLVPIVYPRSLLYLVSGVLEGTPDVPILGMQRFLQLTDVFKNADFPEVAFGRAWFEKESTRVAWSEDPRAGGFGTKSHKHGDFDDDPTTLASLEYILASGY